MTIEYATPFVSPTKVDRIECRDPATLERLGEVKALGRERVQEQVDAARAAQAAWARTSLAERRAVMRTLLGLILDDAERICRLSVTDTGKTMVDAALGELLPVCAKLRYLIRHGERDLRPERRSAGLFVHKAARVEWEPLGVIGVICPASSPFHNLLWPLTPALFAGNAVIAKVSEHTSWSAGPYLALVRRALTEHGHDPELVQIVTGLADTARYLVSARVDKVFFTGSSDAGREVMELASGTLTPVVLELGAKDAMIVCDDADLERAVDKAMSGVFTACGQMCVGIERVYVFDQVYDAFLLQVMERVRALRQGEPLSGLVDIGAVTTARQLDTVEELLGDAVAKGARILAGGSRHPVLKGRFFEPTVLVDVDHSMRIAHEEHFGPVMTVIRVRSEAEAVRLVNDSIYGLGASVFTRDRDRGDRIARQLRTGVAVVNGFGLAGMIPGLPFGGVGGSGFGRVNGREGLRACCNERAIVTDRLPSWRGLPVYPIQPSTFALVQHTARAVYGHGLAGRARAAAQALRGLVTEVRARREG